jgi:hypothetical protein
MNLATHKEEPLETKEPVDVNHPHLTSLLSENKINTEAALPLAPASIILWKTDLPLRAVNVCKLHDWAGRDEIKKGNLKMEEFKPLATIGDLTKWTKKELLELQNCGKKTITDFEGLLSKYGLALRP